MEALETKATDRKDTMASRLTYVGGGVGLGLFAIFGIVNASFVGGIIGLNLAGMISGFPVDSTLLARALVVIGMIVGIMVAGMIFIMTGAIAGWALGKTVDALRAPAAKDNKEQPKESH